MQHMNLSLDRREFLGAVAASLVVLVALLAWNQVYVQPRQDFLLAVAECTGEDTSDAAWKRCSEEIRAELSDSPSPERPHR